MFRPRPKFSRDYGDTALVGAKRIAHALFLIREFRGHPIQAMDSDDITLNYGTSTGANLAMPAT